MDPHALMLLGLAAFLAYGAVASLRIAFAAELTEFRSDHTENMAETNEEGQTR